MDQELAARLVDEWAQPGDHREVRTSLGRALSALPVPEAAAVIEREGGGRLVVAVAGQTLYRVDASGGSAKSSRVHCRGTPLREGEVEAVVRYEQDQREGPAAHTSWEFMLSREDVLAFSTTQPLRASQPVREDEAVARALARALGCALYPADYEAGDEGSDGAPDGREGQEQARFGGAS